MEYDTDGLELLYIIQQLEHLLSHGEYGETPLDKCVFILDTCVNAGGLYVGKVGMVASRTLQQRGY